MINEAIVREIKRTLFVYGAMTFGEWLREKLKDARMSNAELARWVEVSPTYIGNLVRDYSPNTKSGRAPRPSERLVEKIAKKLNADLDEAREAAGYAPQNKLFPARNAKELFEVLDKLGIDIGGTSQGHIADMTEDEFEAFKRDLARAFAVTLAMQKR